MAPWACSTSWVTCVITKTKTRSKKSSIEETPTGFSCAGAVMVTPCYYECTRVNNPTRSTRSGLPGSEESGVFDPALHQQSPEPPITATSARWRRHDLARANSATRTGPQDLAVIKTVAQIRRQRQ